MSDKSSDAPGDSKPYVSTQSTTAMHLVVLTWSSTAAKASRWLHTYRGRGFHGRTCGRPRGHSRRVQEAQRYVWTLHPFKIYLTSPPLEGFPISGKISDLDSELAKAFPTITDAQIVNKFLSVHQIFLLPLARLDHSTPVLLAAPCLRPLGLLLGSKLPIDQSCPGECSMVSYCRGAY